MASRYPLGLFELDLVGQGSFGIVVNSNDLAREYLGVQDGADGWTSQLDSPSLHILQQQLPSFLHSHTTVQVNVRGISYLLMTNRGSDKIYCALIKSQLLSGFAATRRLLPSVHMPSVSAESPQRLRSSISSHLLEQARSNLQHVLRAAEREMRSVTALSEVDIDSISRLQLSGLCRGIESMSLSSILSTFDPSVQFAIDTPTADDTVNIDPFLLSQGVRFALEYFSSHQSKASGSASFIYEEADGEMQIIMTGTMEDSRSLSADQDFLTQPKLVMESAIHADKNLLLCRAFTEAMQGRVFIDLIDRTVSLIIAVPTLRPDELPRPIYTKPVIREQRPQERQQERPQERPYERQQETAREKLQANPSQLDKNAWKEEPLLQQSGNSPKTQHSSSIERQEGPQTKTSFPEATPNIKIDEAQQNQADVGPAKPVKGVRLLKVLIVEDNNINAQVLARTVKLAHSAVVIEIARDGHLAYDLATATAFDCIFMDIDIPIWNGFQVAEALRKHEREQGTPSSYIVGVSGTINTDQERKMKLAGIDTFIHKPVKVPMVKEVLSQLRVE